MLLCCVRMVSAPTSRPPCVFRAISCAIAVSNPSIGSMCTSIRVPSCLYCLSCSSMVL